MKKDQDFLIHYGVMGMKWGVRKSTPSKTGRVTKKKNKISKAIEQTKKKKASESRKKKLEEARVKKAESESKRNVKSLTDAELNKRIARLQKERTYNQLMQSERVSEGRKFVNQIAKESATKVGTATLTYIGGKAVNAMFKDEVIKVGRSNSEKKKKAD